MQHIFVDCYHLKSYLQAEDVSISNVWLEPKKSKDALIRKSDYGRNLNKCFIKSLKIKKHCCTFDFSCRSFCRFVPSPEFKNSLQVLQVFSYSCCETKGWIDFKYLSSVCFKSGIGSFFRPESKPNVFSNESEAIQNFFWLVVQSIFGDFVSVKLQSFTPAYLKSPKFRQLLTSSFTF